MDTTFDDRILQLKEQYYKDNKKNIFFKSAQKLECANTITNKINNKELFNKTFYSINNTNKLYFDYPFFKTFANPSIFNSMSNFIYKVIEKTINKYEKYELHINWNTYSVSGHERYKELYNIFLKKYEDDNKNFNDNLIHLHVYYTPSIIKIISNLMRPLIHPVILEKITLINKNDSNNLLNNLFNNTS